jgi:hypothetical protein
MICRETFGGAGQSKKNVRLLAGNGDLKIQLSITDEFKQQASAILLERVSVEFLLYGDE